MYPENKKRALQGAPLSKEHKSIINSNLIEDQDMLWLKFQERAVLSQHKPTIENIVAAKSAHAIWEASFLSGGGSHNV